jgi:hypothetical protein
MHWHVNTLQQHTFITHVSPIPFTHTHTHTHLQTTVLIRINPCFKATVLNLTNPKLYSCTLIITGCAVWTRSSHLFSWRGGAVQCPQVTSTPPSAYVPRRACRHVVFTHVDMYWYVFAMRYADVFWPGPGVITKSLFVAPLFDQCDNGSVWNYGVLLHMQLAFNAFTPPSARQFRRVPFDPPPAKVFTTDHIQ